jgi:hypothetical protein
VGRYWVAERVRVGSAVDAVSRAAVYGPSGSIMKNTNEQTAMVVMQQKMTG